MKIIYPILFISMISFIYSLFYIDSSSFGFIYILPLSLFIFTLIFHQVFSDYYNSVVFKIFIFQVCIRYTLMPVFFSAEQPLGFNKSLIYLNTAIVVMAIELFFTFIVIAIFSKHQKNSYLKKVSDIETINRPLIIIPVLLVMFSLMYFTNIFEKVNFVWALDSYVEKYVSNNEFLDLNPYTLVLYTPFRVIAALFLISVIYTTNVIKENSKKWMYLLVILTSNIFVFGLSRFSIILFTLPLLILVCSIINKKDAKIVSSFTLISVLLVIAVASIAKFSRYGKEENIESIISAASLNAYFAGPGNIAVGLEALKNNDVYSSLMYIINDTLQNIPILSKLTVSEYRLNNTYNEQIYGHSLYADQIVPLSISGLFHFGTLGIFVYSSIFLGIALLLERLSYGAKHIGYRYIFISLSITLSLVFMLNLSSFYSALSKAFLFIFIPLFVIKKLPSLKYRK